MTDCEPLAQAGAAVWDKIAASVAHAEGLMTPQQRADFWRGLLTGALRTMAVSIGPCEAARALERATQQAAITARAGCRRRPSSVVQL